MFNHLPLMLLALWLLSFHFFNFAYVNKFKLQYNSLAGIKISYCSQQRGRERERLHKQATKQLGAASKPAREQGHKRVNKNGWMFHKMKFDVLLREWENKLSFFWMSAASVFILFSLRDLEFCLEVIAYAFIWAELDTEGKIECSCIYVAIHLC